MKTIMIVCAIVAPSQMASAGKPLLDKVKSLPADVDFVLAVRDMAMIRATPLGLGATELVKSGILLGGANESETLKAWRSLADKLGFSDEKAFDALLGDRFVYASRLRDDGESDWIVFSKASPKIARHVRRKLDVSPREIKNERVLMSLEGGAYRLGSLIEHDTAWLILAPTKQAGLFDQITNMNGQQDWKTLGETQPLNEIRKLGDGELTLYVTLGEGENEGWLGLVANVVGKSVTYEMRYVPGAPLPAIEPWSTEIFDELRDGALFAQIEVLPTQERIRAAHKNDQAPVSLIAGLRTLFEIPHRMLGEELELILGHRLALVVNAKDGGGVSVGAGIDASDVRAMAIPGDAAMRSMVEWIRTEYDAKEAFFEFVGRLPRAVRRIMLVPKINGGSLPPFGDHLGFTWSFRDTPGQAPAGWWVIGTDNRVFDHSANALTGLGEDVDDGQTRAWLTLLEAHPAGLIQSWQSGGGKPLPEIDGFKSVESLWLRIWIPENPEIGIVMGEGSIQITEPRNPRRGPRQHAR